VKKKIIFVGLSILFIFIANPMFTYAEKYSFCENVGTAECDKKILDAIANIDKSLHNPNETHWYCEWRFRKPDKLPVSNKECIKGLLDHQRKLEKRINSLKKKVDLNHP